jgi:hypothetical protein
MRTKPGNGWPIELKNHWVRFRIRDACVPPEGTILSELHGEDLLEGMVTDLSDSGAQRETFAVVSVAGLRQPVVVPVTKLTRMRA